MKFFMSDDEIMVSFNTAKNKKDQVRVLADLNATTQQVIVDKLKALGCDVPDLPVINQKPLRSKEVLFDENRARMLFAEGKSDLECAEMLGICANMFIQWRRKNGMKRPTGGARKAQPKQTRPTADGVQRPIPPEIKEPASEPEAEKQTSVAALGRVLLDLAERYPGLVLTVNGTAVRSLCLNVRVMLGEDVTTSTLDLEVADMEVHMSAQEFNIKAKFVYTKLLPMLQEATQGKVECVSYEGAEDEETVVVHYADGMEVRANVTWDNLLDLAKDVLEAVADVE